MRPEQGARPLPSPGASPWTPLDLAEVALSGLCPAHHSWGLSLRHALCSQSRIFLARVGVPTVGTLAFSKTSSRVRASREDRPHREWTGGEALGKTTGGKAGDSLLLI